jgi:hypothetical protein
VSRFLVESSVSPQTYTDADALGLCAPLGGDSLALLSLPTQARLTKTLAYFFLASYYKYSDGSAHADWEFVALLHCCMSVFLVINPTDSAFQIGVQSRVRHIYLPQPRLHLLIYVANYFLYFIIVRL